MLVSVGFQSRALKDGVMFNEGSMVETAVESPYCMDLYPSSKLRFQLVVHKYVRQDSLKTCKLG